MLRATGLDDTALVDGHVGGDGELAAHRPLHRHGVVAADLSLDDQAGDHDEPGVTQVTAKVTPDRQIDRRQRSARDEALQGVDAAVLSEGVRRSSGT